MSGLIWFRYSAVLCIDRKNSMNKLKKYKLIMFLCLFPFLLLVGYALFTAIREAITPTSSVITFTFSEPFFLMLLIFAYGFWWLWLICITGFIYAAIKAYSITKQQKKETNP